MPGRSCDDRSRDDHGSPAALPGDKLVFDSVKVIDVHGHLSSPPQVRAYAYNLIALRSPGDGELVLGDQDVDAARRRHIRILDERNIDVQLLSPRPAAMMHWERPFLVERWTRTTNNLIAQMCRLEPERFFGVGQLPQNRDADTANCLEELERCIGELGFVGAVVNPDPGGDGLAPGVDQPYWFPLYERAQALGAALLVHPSLSRDPRIEGLSHSYQFNNLVQETLATSLLENSDVFARFPELKIVVCHCGGAPRRLLGDGEVLDALEDPLRRVHPSGEAPGGQTGMAFAGATHRQAAGEGNLFFDTCSYDPHLLGAVLHQRGVARLAFGTEAPGSGSHLVNPGTGRPADDLLATLQSLGGLSAAQVRAVVHDNPLRAFPLLAGRSGT
jgi:predicted TIM-barrel fold metal-dependent hydrolase